MTPHVCLTSSGSVSQILPHSSRVHDIGDIPLFRAVQVSVCFRWKGSRSGGTGMKIMYSVCEERVLCVREGYENYC